MITREEAEALAARLVGDMTERWRRGERPLTEDFLTRHPELWDHPAAVADLIYEEFSLRQELGPEVPVEQMLGRFPQWRPQLELLFDCQRILGPHRAEPQFPVAGDFLGDFLLRAELGVGAHGRVFLASQHSLGNRLVVLKLTPLASLSAGATSEHLSLARLQHTHIVPVYSVQDYPARRLHGLCMPYFGGATLAQLLAALKSQPPERRTGQALLGALDAIQPPVPLPSPAARGPARQALARASYVEAVCWMGACMADALQYAHERGLLHLDLKPSNVLLAPDGQPMLLDFHLARGPIRPDADEPLSVGGTAGYMSPEQHLALECAQQGRPAPLPVDGRSDVFSLGVVLREALTGTGPGPRDPRRPWHGANREVSPGLVDLIDKCLASDPRHRYATMGALATDLRRHLAHLPLRGVRNRSLGERWSKWRRRRPHGVALGGMMAAVLLAAGAVAIGATSHFTQQIQEEQSALHDGKMQMLKGDLDASITTLQHALAVARGSLFQGALADELEHQLRVAEGAREAARRTAAARELHALIKQLRFVYGADQLAPAGLAGLEESCRAAWEKRARILDRLNPAGRAEPDPGLREDLLDLAIFRADLQVRLAPPDGREPRRRKALAILAEAEAMLGPSPVLDEERNLHGAAVSPSLPVASTAWEHYALGRALLRAGDVHRAAEEAARAVRLNPQGLWPNFYLGLCAHRLGRHAEAVTCFSVCIGAAPDAAGCFYNRALAFEALGDADQAQRDYDQALHLDARLAVAALNRGMLHYRARRYAAALADLERARDLGAEPATVLFDLALVHQACGDRAAALDDLDRALSHDPQHPDARKLRDSLSAR